MCYHEDPGSAPWGLPSAPSSPLPQKSPLIPSSSAPLQGSPLSPILCTPRWSPLSPSSSIPPGYLPSAPHPSARPQRCPLSPILCPPRVSPHPQLLPPPPGGRGEPRQAEPPSAAHPWRRWEPSGFRRKSGSRTSPPAGPSASVKAPGPPPGQRRPPQAAAARSAGQATPPGQKRQPCAPVPVPLPPQAG